MKNVPAKNVKTPDQNKPKPLAVSHFYAVKKYGLYDYQVVMLSEQGEVNVGQSNVYQVVAGDLVDRMINDLLQGKK
jgi:hypothetical protein